MSRRRWRRRWPHPARPMRMARTRQGHDRAAPACRACGDGRAGGALAARRVARACQRKLVGRRLGLSRAAADRPAGDRRRGGVRAAGGAGRHGAVSEDRARPAGRQDRGRPGPLRLGRRRCAGESPRAMPWTDGSWRPSRPAPCRPATTTCTAVTSTATTAAMRRSGSCRAIASRPLPWRCRTSPGSASKGRWSDRRRLRIGGGHEASPPLPVQRSVPPRHRHSHGRDPDGHVGSDRSIHGVGSRPRRARPDLAGRRAGPAGRDRGAACRDGTLGRARPDRSAGPCPRRGAAGGTRPGRGDRAGAGTPFAPVRSGDRRRPRYPVCRTAPSSRRPARVSTRWPA